MNALQITLRAEGAISLPVAYNHMIQGALYSAWRGAFPQLHEEGFSAGGRAFRMFTFSPLEDAYRAEEKIISFTGPVRLEVRSPVPSMPEALAEHLLREGVMQLGRQTLAVASLDCRDRLLFPDSAEIVMRSPVTLHGTLPDGHTRYYAPTDADFPAALAQNTAAKLEAAGQSADPGIRCVPFERTLRKRVTSFKGTWISGYTCRFRLACAPETMAFLYYTGLGAGNSQGFGMFDIEV